MVRYYRTGKKVYGADSAMSLRRSKRKFKRLKNKVLNKSGEIGE